MAMFPKYNPMGSWARHNPQAASPEQTDTHQAGTWILREKVKKTRVRKKESRNQSGALHSTAPSLLR